MTVRYRECPHLPHGARVGSGRIWSPAAGMFARHRRRTLRPRRRPSGQPHHAQPAAASGRAARQHHAKWRVCQGDRAHCRRHGAWPGQAVWPPWRTRMVALLSVASRLVAVIW